MDDLTELRDWLFRAMTFEAEAEAFRRSGIRIGADQRAAETQILEGILAPFPIELRNKALRMSRLYTQVYCFENSVRQLIRERMTERHGADWWNSKAPRTVRDYAQRMQSDATKNSWLEGEAGDFLTFVTLGQLTDIIVNNWDDFSDLVPSQHWLKQKFEEVEKARNWVAHNRLLSAAEFIRMETHISDWNRQTA